MDYAAVLVLPLPSCRRPDFLSVTVNVPTTRGENYGKGDKDDQTNCGFGSNKQTEREILLHHFINSKKLLRGCGSSLPVRLLCLF